MVYLKEIQPMRRSFTAASPINETPIQLFKVFVARDAAEQTSKTLTSGYITQGPRVAELEEKLGEYLQNPYVLTLNSATSGLHLALHMLKSPAGAWPGLAPGDEVLTPALTCTATNWPILANGLRPKWVDVDPKTANISLEDLKYKLSPTTKVLQFVHWGGSPVDLDAIKDIQQFAYERFGFRPVIIEDAAHAMGAEWKGRRIGALENGNIVVFSLQAIKHLTTGDGGLLLLPDKNLYTRGKLLRWYGIDRDKRNYKGKDFRLESDVTEYGFKMHMNDLAASLGLANLPHIDGIVAKHRANASFYDKALAGVNGVTLLTQPEGAVSSYWIYTFHIANKLEFIEFMKSKNVVVSQVHAMNDTHSVCAPYRTHLPQLDRTETTLICIPVGWWITPSEREYVADSIKEFASTLPVQRSIARKKIIITGGCGFIGHHVVEHLAKTTDCNLVVIDKLSYASLGYDRLRDTGVLDRVKVFTTDLVQPIPEGIAYELGNNIEFIVHMAAETHVDNSIADPVPFIRNNVESTISLLEYTRGLIRNGCDLKAFFYFSTDEVFGPALGTTMFDEWDRHKPTNPYSSSKSAAENICIAYENTYKIPLMIVNVMNAFGERQHPEKFIPKCIKKVIDNEKVFIHSYPDRKTSGTRFYIHARNIAAAVIFLLNEGAIGEKYNITGESEVSNLELAQFIADTAKKTLVYELVNHHATRPGHDLRYDELSLLSSIRCILTLCELCDLLARAQIISIYIPSTWTSFKLLTILRTRVFYSAHNRYGLSGEKMAKMGWVPPFGFEESLRKCIQWTIANSHWLNLKMWADDPNTYEGIVPSAIGKDPMMERAAKL